MARIRAYKANTIAEDVYSSLEKDILNLTIKPGQLLTEQDICERYNISRTPSRDVLQRLNNSGLVVNIPYKANYVSLLDMDRIRQFIYMRKAIETMVIRDAIKNLDDQLVAGIEYNLRLQETLLKSDFTAEDFYKIDGELHKVWFKATNKLIVWDQIQKLQVHYTRFRMLDIVAEHSFQAIYEEHKELADIIKNKEINRIEEFVSKHLNGGIERLGERIYTEFTDYFIHDQESDI
ncbi:GntR family transcriptional regulator [Serpentinicella alkaliphila]|uniref:DNA-binding GntR family transcriptional regulator n=1 Tax=Serpentinicella alkaliphila TaxID=1734049 RepID=A0A4R2TVN7_9FIRM|nr:GntR family transcriptional regulator [Serpentinicella alkaliphila]QUH26832.1 GntR family transcriptional regulator [Serpentinicella alkaliphila]TCQ08058.1 DNA-binding GntR family transcriptional regulator [Serpentinicella alkaliphila]